METTSPKLPELTPEQIWRAADYVELVWQDQGSDQERAALEKFHQDGEVPARLMASSAHCCWPTTSPSCPNTPTATPGTSSGSWWR
ncbi:hypothetical protein [Streptomyces atratus]|uniref:hypothetical protein n=1 Tax=Streptomyces atratus TaxID=1893 RepID=UPI0036466874